MKEIKVSLEDTENEISKWIEKSITGNQLALLQDVVDRFMTRARFSDRDQQEIYNAALRLHLAISLRIERLAKHTI